MTKYSVQPEEEIKPASDKGLQILQTIMLAVLIGGMTWNVSTTVKHVETVSRVVTQIQFFQHQLDEVSLELKRLRDTDTMLEHRVTLIESSGQNKYIK